MTANNNQKVIDLLATFYTAEIGAIGIYMDQHIKCSHLGFNKLAAIFMDDAKEEMKHAEELAERIMFLGGELKYGVKPFFS